jgi:hypothetical protein
LVSSSAFAAPVIVTAQSEVVNVTSLNSSSMTMIAITQKSAMPETDETQPGYVINQYLAFQGTGAELSCVVKRIQMSPVGESICAVSFDPEKSSPAIEISTPPAALGRVVQATFRDRYQISQLVEDLLDLKMGLAVESDEKVDVTYENGKTFKVPRLQIRCDDASVGHAPTSCTLTGVLN